MSLLSLPLEFEFALAGIAAEYYPNNRFKLTAEIKKDFLKIDFQGYFIENFTAKNRRYSNLMNEYYRNKRVDFRLFWANGELALSGWWRTEILSFEYTPFMQQWLSEEGEEISRPYPDGEEFEDMATSLYPLLQQYFPVKYSNPK